VREKKLEGVTDLRDESDRHGLRIVLELKREAPDQLIINKLYNNTRLETRHQMLLLAIKDGAPKVLTLKEMLTSFIDFRRTVIIRRSYYELEQERKKAHILEGLSKALDELDAVIDLIRKSSDNNEAKQGLRELLEITEIQATEILNLRLAKLTGLERGKIIADLKESHKKIKELEQLLASEELIREKIKEEIIEVRDKYGDDRKTEIVETVKEFTPEDLIEEKEMVVTTTLGGYIKRTSLDKYRMQKRGGKGKTAMVTKEEDVVNRLYIATTHHNLYFFTSGGLLFSKKVWELPERGRNAKGIPMVNLLSIPKEERIAAMMRAPENKDCSFLFISSKGYVKRLKASKIKRISSRGLKVVDVRTDDYLVDVILLDGTIDEVVTVSRFGKGVRFKVDEVRTMGRTARGVIGIRLKKDDRVIGLAPVKEEHYILTATELGYGKLTRMEDLPTYHRGAGGVIAHKVTAKTGGVVSMHSVRKEDEIMLITQSGILLWMSVKKIPIYGRAARGVRLQKLKGGEKIAGISLVVEK